MSPKEQWPALSRLYVWSLVFEPLLFFILIDAHISAIPTSVSRILQVVVIACVMVRALGWFADRRAGALRVISPGGRLYVNIAIYFSVLIVAGIVGLTSGAYSLSESYREVSQSILTRFADGTANSSDLYRFINAPTLRPVVEYVIVAYYIGYFVVLPRYLLASERSIDYFLSVFTGVFVISLFLGFVDVGLATMGVDFIPRHLSDGVHVGRRFHGLAGEPRQAVIYLFFGLAILHLRAHLRGRRVGKWWIVSTVVAALLTESISGLLGVLAFLALYVVYSLGTVRRVIQMLAVTTVVLGSVYAVGAANERVRQYMESASNLWTTLESGQELPFLLTVQMDSIYPLYDLTVKIRNIDLVPVAIGSGLGSASAVTNRYSGLSQMSNPNSQFVRILFESGFLGLLFYVRAFTRPVKHLTNNHPTRTQHGFMAMVLLLIGGSLGVRSPVPFIYLGVLIASFRSHSGASPMSSLGRPL